MKVTTNYSEKVATVSGCYQANDRHRPRPMATSRREDHGLPAQGTDLVGGGLGLGARGAAVHGHVPTLLGQGQGAIEIIDFSVSSLPLPSEEELLAAQESLEEVAPVSQ